MKNKTGVNLKDRARVNLTTKKNLMTIMILMIIFIMLVCLSSCAGAGKSDGEVSGGGQQEEQTDEQADKQSGKQSGEQQESDEDKPVIAIAWHNNQESYSFVSTLKTVEAAGAEPVVLDMVQSSDLEYDDEGMLSDSKDKHGILASAAAKRVKINRWQHSNAEEVFDDYDCVIFPGGSDISPTLYYHEQGWHGIEDDTDYSAERDVSDYLLMTYCLDNDVPMFCICRGMQMLSVVSGASVVQDIGIWLKKKGVKYSDIHRDPEKKDLVPHPVAVKSHKSLLYDITGKDIIKGVPSWHHQIVSSVKNTPLKVTAYTETDGVKLIEGVERKDKNFAMGVQFHPEVAVRKVVDKEKNAGEFMDYDLALSFFTRLIEEGQEYRSDRKNTDNESNEDSQSSEDAA